MLNKKKTTSKKNVVNIATIIKLAPALLHVLEFYCTEYCGTVSSKYSRCSTQLKLFFPYLVTQQLPLVNHSDRGREGGRQGSGFLRIGVLEGKGGGGGENDQHPVNPNSSPLLAAAAATAAVAPPTTTAAHYFVLWGLVFFFLFLPRSYKNELASLGFLFYSCLIFTGNCMPDKEF